MLAITSVDKSLERGSQVLVVGGETLEPDLLVGACDLRL